MPPKAKLNMKSGKAAPKIVANPESSGESSDQSERFEVELLWCIQELQNAIESKKLSEKQGRDVAKCLKTLTNPNAPAVQKRQLMRQHLGDYRAKMLKEEQKSLREANTNMRLSQPEKPKYTFIKVSNLKSSQGGHKFNFSIDKNSDEKECAENCGQMMQNIQLEDSSKPTTFSYVPSINDFRFNF